MPRYEFVEGKSSKFWEIDIEGRTVTTRWGRIGTAGQSATKSFPSPPAAQVEHDKLVAEKLKKGYRSVDDGPPAPPAAAGPESRFDVSIYNEATGFLFTSEGQRAQAPDEGGDDWNEGVRAGLWLPVELVQDDSFNVRVVVNGELTQAEADEWVGKLTWKLQVPDGRLVVCGGSIFVMDEDDEYTMQFTHVHDVPPGEYQATVYVFAHSINGEHLMTMAAGRKPEPLGHYFRRTRPGEKFPPWLHNYCAMDPDVDPGHQKEWKNVKEIEGVEMIDFLLHLTPPVAGSSKMPKLDQGFFEWGVFDARLPERCPRGVEAHDLIRPKEDAPAEPVPVVPVDVWPRVQAFPLAAVDGGSAEAPINRLGRVYRLAWFATDSAQPEIRISLPAGAKFDWEGTEIPGVAAELGDNSLRIGFVETGAKWETLRCVAQVANQLGSLPDGSIVELVTATDEQEGPRPIGLHRYRGTVTGGVWRINEAFPAVDNARLNDALALSAQTEKGVEISVKDEAEADEALRLYKQEWAMLLKENPVIKKPGLLRFKKEDFSDACLMAQIIFRMRYADTWPATPSDAEEMADIMAGIQATISDKIAAVKPGEVILEGQNRRLYHAADMRAVGAAAPARVDETDQAMQRIGFVVLGDLICTPLSDVVIRGYAQPEGDTYGILVLGKFGQDTFDFSTRFEEASLTTTKTPGMKDDKKKKAFKTSHPRASLSELYTHHLTRKAQLAPKYGEPIRARAQLRALAGRIETYFQNELDG